MADIRSGQITAFYLFDIAEGADLPAVQTLLGGAGHEARLALRPPLPGHVHYHQPPVQADGEALGLAPIDGFQVRLKMFDYGVCSLALTRPFSGSWQGLLEQVLGLTSSGLDSRAEACCREVAGRLRSALQQPREDFLSEDYLVIGVTALSESMTAEALVTGHGGDIAQLLRSERDVLSTQERDEVLRHRLSYFVSDLVVPSWNGAFVYDTEAGLAGALELLEFANSQLLQFRYYDQRLEHELTRIYARLQVTRWYEPWIGRRYTAAARELHGLFIDVNELTERTSNALKVVGDVYAARLLGLTSARLGLDAWKSSVRDKLKTLDDIYRFAVDQTGMDRGEILEAAIVFILLLELVLFFMGIMT